MINFSLWFLDYLESKIDDGDDTTEDVSYVDKMIERANRGVVTREEDLSVPKGERELKNISTSLGIIGR